MSSCRATNAKTKEQAARDKKRDRFFVREGLKLIRFTGSEIHRAPAACAGEVLLTMRSDIEAAIERSITDWRVKHGETP